MLIQLVASGWTPFVGDAPLSDIGRTLAAGVLMYIAIVVILRVSGKRTLSKLNAFDLVVSVALGSVVATAVVSSTTSVAEGIAAAGVLVGGQYAITRLSVRLRIARRLVRSSSAVLVLDGEVRSSTLDRQRMTEGELRQAIRMAGFGGYDTVGAVVLETDGSVSVIGVAQLGDRSALEDRAQG